MEGENSETKTEDPITLSEVASDAPKKDSSEGNCYCGKERNLNIVELLCASCNRWFHESCISYQLGKLVPFMTNYSFVCKNCSATNLESFKKNQCSFPQMILTAMGNLVQTSVKEGNPRRVFSKDQDIIPFIDSHWESLTTIGRRVTQSWHSTIQRALAKDTGILFVTEEVEGQGEMYGLALNLTDIKPNYDAQHATSGVKSRSAKRKFIGDQGGGGPGKKGRGGGDTGAPKLPAHGYPLEHPYNKDGYRYILAEPDIHAPFLKEFDESNEWSGKPIPAFLKRVLCPTQVLLALHDRAPQLKVSEDRLSVTGEKGYCMIRATHSVNRGTWYYEVTVEDMPEGTAARIGWAQEYGNLQAPLGYDKFGYSWRSRKGTRFHECRGKHYSGGYGEGDSLGFLITLPELSDCNYIPPTYKDRMYERADEASVEQTMADMLYLTENDGKLRLDTYCN